VAMVMRTRYRAPNGTPVVAASNPSTNFMFCIYRDLDPPYGLAPRGRRPPYVHYTLPLLPRFSPSVFPFDWFSRLFPAGLVLWVVAFSWSWNACGVVCFSYICLARQSVIYNPGLLNGVLVSCLMGS